MSFRAILATYIAFGDTPDTVSRQVRNGCWLLALLPLGIYVAALTQLPAPLGPFRGDGPLFATVVSYAGTGLLLCFGVVSCLLTFMGRALGMFLLIALSMYGGLMVAALMVAAVPIGSLSLLLGTFALAVWSLMGVASVNARVPAATIDAIRRERLEVRDQKVWLIPAGALEGRGVVDDALNGLRSGWAMAAEFIGALAVISVGGVLVPISIAADAGAQGWIAPVLWFVTVSIFLVARGSVNTWFLLVRAMAIGPDPKA